MVRCTLGVQVWDARLVALSRYSENLASIVSAPVASLLLAKVHGVAAITPYQRPDDVLSAAMAILWFVTDWENIKVDGACGTRKGGQS